MRPLVQAFTPPSHLTDRGESQILSISGATEAPIDLRLYRPIDRTPGQISDPRPSLIDPRQVFVRAARYRPPSWIPSTP
jgi:hypothetical protein